MSINFVAVSGNLVRDAELKPVGRTFVMEITVAHNRMVNGEKRTSYFKCKMWDGEKGRAHKLADYLPKGAKVTVTGRLEQDTWETKDGQRRSENVIVINEIEFMDKRQAQPVASAPQSRQDDLYDEEIPF